MRFASMIRLAPGVVLAAVTACRESPTAPIESPLPALVTDPAPTAPGIFLGDAVTPALCTGGSQSDTDLDGLADICERELAAAFAPELAYASADSAWSPAAATTAIPRPSCSTSTIGRAVATGSWTRRFTRRTGSITCTPGCSRRTRA
jgi:hypothetical protein